MKLKFKILNEQSFYEYKTWFTDKELNEQLGPMDKETWETWQQNHTTQEPSDELAFYLNNELVAVVDVTLPTQEDFKYYIPTFAVHPKKKRSGIGSAVFQQLLANYTQSQIWRCHIDHQNNPSMRFFERHGFKKITGVNEHGMVTFELVVGGWLLKSSENI